MTIVTDETLQATLTEFQKFGSNQSATAEALGIARSTLQNRLKVAAERGLSPLPLLHEPQPPGWTIKFNTALYDGTTGEVKQVWRRAEPEHNRLLKNIEIIREAFEEIKGAGGTGSPVAEPTAFGYENWMTLYPVADLHLGMYSWRHETGNDYDVYIAMDQLKQTFGHVMRGAVSTPVAVILNLGDYFHADNDDKRTRRSGNIMDVDTRYHKVLAKGKQLFVWMVDQALTKHQKVIVRCLKGNHDDYAAIALAIALDAYYHDNPRVEVDLDPGPFWWFQWGRTLLGAAHGHETRAEDMPGIMAATVPRLWGETTWRYVWLGHLHSKRKLVSEVGGADVEVLRTIAPRDAWGKGRGFVSGRNMHSIAYSKEGGEEFRITKNLPMEMTEEQRRMKDALHRQAA